MSAEFNPNDSRYRICCCHSKTITIAFGLLEFVVICFALVTDLNTKICKYGHVPSEHNVTLFDNWTMSSSITDNTTLLFDVINESSKQNIPRYNTSDPLFNRLFRSVQSMSCNLNFFWLLWTIGQAFSICLMFFGIKSVKWLLILPHIAFRLILTLALTVSIAVLIVAFTSRDTVSRDTVVTPYLIVNGLVLLLFIFLIYCELRCCLFVKRSSETGFSLSTTHPIPQSIETEENNNNRPKTKQLPPLRHTHFRPEQQQNVDIVPPPPHYSKTNGLPVKNDEDE